MAADSGAQDENTSENKNGEIKAHVRSEIIVVAEDSAPNRTILCHLLKKLNFEVIECENGSQAWEQMEQSRKKKIVAVLSDIMMPEMDGLELLEKIREDGHFKKLPVILVTAVSEKDYILKAKTLTVNGYILKPVTFKRVLGKLKEIFPKRDFPKIAA